MPSTLTEPSLKPSWSGAASPPGRRSWGRSWPGRAIRRSKRWCAAAATYPEAGVEQRMTRFLAQAQAAQWYVGEAAKRDDPYLAGWAASRLALFACRLVLAHNRVLYPFHKWLLRTVAEVPERPDDFVDLVRALAIERTPAAAEAVVVSLLLFREWPQAQAGWSTQFMLDSEWNWLDGEPPIDDL